MGIKSTIKQYTSPPSLFSRLCSFTPSGGIQRPIHKYQTPPTPSHHSLLNFLIMLSPISYSPNVFTLFPNWNNTRKCCKLLPNAPRFAELLCCVSSATSLLQLPLHVALENFSLSLLTKYANALVQYFSPPIDTTPTRHCSLTSSFVVVLGNLRVGSVAVRSAVSQSLCLSRSRVSRYPRWPLFSHYLPPPFILSLSLPSIILWSWLGYLSQWLTISHQPFTRSACPCPYGERNP